METGESRARVGSLNINFYKSHLETFATTNQYLDGLLEKYGKYAPATRVDSSASVNFCAPYQSQLPLPSTYGGSAGHSQAWYSTSAAPPQNHPWQSSA
eukprot:CAMPEP_0177613412 /NCGR_PEP_ID=MMETSP0419_2-20121207/21942_1 /TAXON_ID=582737 /ORGANISM="Tetraselmis sp., Strain GSL018" /LENGTH=97 /DNA_ID=CAMNT_0019110069 /DNA_START=533 /DNA_END=823 /DNA_ORIENTATION=-